MEVLEPTAEHTHTIILLHGRHSTASSYKSDFFESESSEGLTLPELFPSIKWVFPSASNLYSKSHKKYTSQWFDMARSSHPHHRSESQDLISSFHLLSTLISAEARLIGHSNLFLGGIHQGAAIAIHSLLAQPHRLAGFISIGSWFPRPQRSLSYFLGQTQPCAQIQTPALIFHNSDDDEIHIKYGRELHNTLCDIGMRSKLHTYETGGNWLNEPEGVDALCRWLCRRIGRRSIDSSRPAPTQIQTQQGDYFSTPSTREVKLLARRIHENMPEERKTELLEASFVNRRDDPFATQRRLSCDPVEKYCLSRAQRQLSLSSGSGKGEKGMGLGGRMALVDAS